MNLSRQLIVACLIASGAAAEELNWADLARRPELWPTQCTVKEAMKFQGGATVQAGQKVNVVGFKANEVELSTADGRLNFAAEPDETDVLAVAREAYAKLTPKQRALSYNSLAQQKDLWPARVTLVRTFELGGGKVVRAGDQLRLMNFEPGKVLVLAEELKATFQVVPQATDLMAQARKFVEDPQAGLRYVVVEQKLAEEKQVAEGQKVAEAKQKAQVRVITELQGKLVSSLTGKPEPLDGDALPRYLVFYRGSSTCPITRKFTPTLIKYYQETKPKHPEFEVIYLMTEPVADTGKFARQAGFSWRAVDYDSTGAMPTVNRPIDGRLPQLIVMDRSGKVLANGVQSTAPAALKQLDALLNQSTAQN